MMNICTRYHTVLDAVDYDDAEQVIKGLHPEQRLMGITLQKNESHQGKSHYNKEKIFIVVQNGNVLHEYWSDLYREERDIDDRDYEPVFNCTYCERELSTCSDDLFPTLDHFIHYIVTSHET